MELARKIRVLKIIHSLLFMLRVTLPQLAQTPSTKILINRKTN